VRITIDRQVRDALYEACRSRIESCSDLQIDDSRKDREAAMKLRSRLSLLGPLLDQIGWGPVSYRESFSVKVNARRMRPFVRRDIGESYRALRECVTTEAELRDELRAWRQSFSDDEWRDELASMRADVDRDLDRIAALKRLLEQLEQAAYGEAAS
jgi:hypothetical protein